MKLKAELQEARPLGSYISKLENECRECSEETARRIAGLRAAHREEVDELTERLEQKNVEIEKLKKRIGSAGRQPITQIQIEKIREYHEKGHTYRSIAYHVGCSTSTISKYITQYENK